jgi:hypothetical protein
MSGLVKVRLCACATLAPNALTPSSAIQTADLVIAIPPLRLAGIPGRSQAFNKP